MNGMTSHEWRGTHTRIEVLEEALAKAVEYIASRTDWPGREELLDEIVHVIIVPSVKQMVQEINGG